MAYRETDRHNLAVRKWLAGEIGPEGEQLALPGMPVPPAATAVRLAPFVLNTYADSEGRGIYPGKNGLARVLGVKPRRAAAIMQQLAALGLYVRVGKSRGGRGLAQEWRCDLPKWAARLAPSTRGGNHVLGDVVSIRKLCPGATQNYVLQDTPSIKDDLGNVRDVSDVARTSPKTTLPPCQPQDDGSGITCSRCNLPLHHKRHAEAV